MNLIKLVMFMTFTLLLTFSGLATAISEEQNLVSNPGFEDGSTFPLNWKFWSIDGNTPVWDTASHNGQRSIIITISGTIDSKSGMVSSNNINARPLQKYTFSAWVKTQNAMGSHAPIVKVTEEDINTNWLRDTELTIGNGTNDWSQKTIDFQTGPDTAYLHVAAKLWNSYGTLWVDDIALNLKSTTPTITTPTTESSGGTYYVAKNGNDNNPGTEASPWLTIQKAANKAIAGDTIYVKKGTYTEHVIFPNSGTSGNYITFRNYPTDIVTVRPPVGGYLNIISNGPYHTGNFEMVGKSYIKIKGFDFTTGGSGSRIECSSGYCQTPDASISTEGGAHDIIIDSNIFNDIDKAAIIAGYHKNKGIDYAAWDITFINNQIHRPTDWEWVELLSFDSVNRPNVSYNKITYQGNGECIDYKSGTDNGIVSHNIISNCWRPIDGMPKRWVGIYIDAYDEGVNNNRIFSNIVSKTEGIVAGSERGGLAQNNIFYNNIMYDNVLGSGLSSSHESGYMNNYKNNVFINNIAYNNDVNYYARASGTGNIFRNNIGWKGINQLSSSHIQDHNLFGIDPQFVNPEAVNFHLESSSPAIDAGSSVQAPNTDFDGNPRPRGGGYDIGSFEN